MKVKYLLVVLCSLLVWLVTFSVVMYFLADTSVWTLLFTFTICCLIAAIVFVLSRSSTTKHLEQIKAHEKKSLEEYRRLEKINEIVEQTLRKNNAEYEITYNQTAKRLLKDIEIVMALKVYVRWFAYQSALGKLRNGEKEKAQKQIAETELTLNAIAKISVSESAKLDAKLTELKNTYQKMLSGHHDQTELPSRLVHLACGHDLTCEHCGDAIRKGDFKYRS